MSRLNELTEELNEALLEAETALANLRVGVEAEVVLASGHVLRFTKVGSQWGLVVSNGDHFMPLLKAGRAVRLSATEALPALYTAMLARRDQLEVEVASATDRVRDFVASLPNLQAARDP